MPNSANVRVAGDGGAYTAPSGTTIPTDVGTSLDPGFDEVGYITEDGVTLSTSEDITDLKAWQDSAVVRKLQTSHDVTFAFTMMEINPTSLAAYFGDDYQGAGVIAVSGAQAPRGPWVLEFIDGDAEIRVVIPDGQVTERGDMTFSAADSINLPITITCFPDVTGKKFYVYLDDEADGS